MTDHPASDQFRGEVPHQSVYPTVMPGEELDVYDGPAQLGEHPAQRLRIWAPLRHDLALRWQCFDDDIPLDPLGSMEVPVLIQRPDGESSVPLTHFGRRRGRVGQVELGIEGPVPLARVVTHWFNLPHLLPASLLSGPGAWWAGRWAASCGPWQLTLDARPDLDDVMKLADELDEKFAMTHIGVLRRIDGGTFSRADALDALQGWQLAMSFALGRWVAPALPVGTDENGVSAWEMWAPWRCDGLAGAPSAWWDDHTADDLATFVDLFLQHWLDPTRRAVVSHVAHHAIAANHSGTTLEARILIAQAGLEYSGVGDIGTRRWAAEG